MLDLFAGLGGWSEPFRDRGHEVITLDFEPSFGCDITADILEWDGALPWTPDIILASPPCEAFSVLQIGRNWTKPTDTPPHAPKTAAAWTALKIAQRTREIIDTIGPRYFVVENPRAKLRKLPPFADLDRRTVTYCQFGEPFMKPTDLWGGFPPSLVLAPPCVTRHGAIVDIGGIPWVENQAGEPCHVSAPRGSTTGIQGDGVVTSRTKSRDSRGGLSAQKALTRDVLGTSDTHKLAALRAKIPYALALAVCEAAEADLAAGLVAASGQLSWE